MQQKNKQGYSDKTTARTTSPKTRTRTETKRTTTAKTTIPENNNNKKSSKNNNSEKDITENNNNNRENNITEKNNNNSEKIWIHRTKYVERWEKSTWLQSALATRSQRHPKICYSISHRNVEVKLPKNSTQHIIEGPIFSTSVTVQNGGLDAKSDYT